MGLVSILIFLGYVDQRPAVQLANQSMQQQVIAALVRPCQGEQKVCGFRFVDIDRLEKQSQGVVYQVRLRNAGYSQRDDLNRGMYRTQQNSLSRTATEEFWQALQTPGVHVYYLGHSRFGWGPDFSPPVLTAGDRVNRSYYLSTDKMKAGFRALALVSGIRAATLGLFSCDSGDLILEPLQSHFPQVRFVGTSQVLLPDQAVAKFIESLRTLF